MKKKKCLTLLCLLGLAAILLSLFAILTPVFSKEVATLTIQGSCFNAGLAKVTLYSNRFLLIDNKTGYPVDTENLAHQKKANLLFSASKKVPRDDYNEIIASLDKLDPNAERLTSDCLVLMLGNVGYCLRYDSGYYYHTLSDANLGLGSTMDRRVLETIEKIQKHVDIDS